MLDVVNEAGSSEETGLIRILVAAIVYVGLLGVLVSYLLWKLPRDSGKPEDEDSKEH